MRFHLYLTAAMLRGIFIALLILIGYESVNDYLRFHSGAAISLTELALDKLLLFPGQFVEWLPYAVLLGGLVSIGVLASRGELQAMKLAGLSNFQLSAMMVMPVLLLSLLGVAAMQYVSPQLHEMRLRENHRAVAQHDLGSLWYREGLSRSYLGAIKPGGQRIEKLAVYINNEHRLVTVLKAREARYNADNSIWTLYDVSRTDIENPHTSTENLPSIEWRTELTPTLLNLLLSPSELLSLSERWQYARQLQLLAYPHRDYSNHLLTMWKIVFSPLTAVGLLLIALGFIFGPLRGQDMGMRLGAGLLTGLLFDFGSRTLGIASQVFGFAPLWAVLLSSLLPIAAGLILMLRAN